MLRHRVLHHRGRLLLPHESRSDHLTGCRCGHERSVLFPLPLRGRTRGGCGISPLEASRSCRLIQAFFALAAGAKKDSIRILVKPHSLPFPQRFYWSGFVHRSCRQRFRSFISGGLLIFFFPFFSRAPEASVFPDQEPGVR